MLLSLFLDYFIETAVSSGEGLDLYFGISVFKAMLSSLIFLAVKPLDSTFYLLLVLKCAQHLARGLGLKSLIWDACSRARWKKDFHTRPQNNQKSPTCSVCCCCSDLWESRNGCADSPRNSAIANPLWG